MHFFCISSVVEMKSATEVSSKGWKGKNYVSY